MGTFTSNISVEKAAQKKTEHLDKKLMKASAPVAKVPKEALVGSDTGSVAQVPKEKPQELQVGVPQECVACRTCDGGPYSQKVATLITGNWLEYGDSCSGEEVHSASDYPYICCFPSSESLAVHV